MSDINRTFESQHVQKRKTKKKKQTKKQGTDKGVV